LEDAVEKGDIRIATGEGLQVVSLRSGKVEEFHVMAVPPAGRPDAWTEASSLYASVLEALADAGPLRIVAEQLHLDLGERDAALAARADTLDGSSVTAGNPVSTIDGRPCERRGVSGVLMTLVRETDGVGVTPVHDGPRLCGYRIDDGQSVRVYLTAMDGILPDRPAGSAAEQAEIMFRRTEKALQSEGFSYRKVVCTRIRLRRMLAWYGEFNRVRNACYRSLGILADGPSPVPPSTGIQGKASEQGECVMEVAAMTCGEEGCPFVRLVNPLQNEATDYGSAFARGGAVDMPGVRYVFISGTASIDTTGKSVFVDDARAQVVKTIENFETIAKVGGASIADFCQAIWYCKDPSYAAVVREEMTRRGWPKLPCLFTVADVCRADLLVEMEGLAVVPAP
jgi:enamine deaminase RidA (YjgF/YER057c/UK114 family)